MHGCDLARIRAVVAAGPDTGTPICEDDSESRSLTRAAVLFPIVLHHGAPTVLLTQRSAHLKDHPGQISFPGGRVEAIDADAVATALRETEEEIGLARARVEIVGFLPEYRTGTGFSVTPVVGFVSPPFEVLPDAFEVESVFEVPLAFLLDAANHKWHSMEYGGRQRTFYAIPYGERFIWGATAGMIRSLYDRFIHAG